MTCEHGSCRARKPKWNAFLAVVWALTLAWSIHTGHMAPVVMSSMSLAWTLDAAFSHASKE